MDKLKEINALSDPARLSAQSLDRKTWKRFVGKNILIYVITNVFFNSVVPYCSFEDPSAVSLFRGTYCIARFLLPLAFFIPLLVTIDMGNKIQVLFRKKIAGFSFPAHFRFKSFLWQQSLLNASVTFVLTLCIMLALHLLMPPDYTYSGLGGSALMGIYAGAVALFFMKRTIRQLTAAEIVRIDV